MRTPTLDPTAGETARAIHLDPGAIRHIGDPTDPRYGQPSVEARASIGDAQRILDPTNPGWRDLAARA